MYVTAIAAQTPTLERRLISSAIWLISMRIMPTPLGNESASAVDSHANKKTVAHSRGLRDGFCAGHQFKRIGIWIEATLRKKWGEDRKPAAWDRPGTRRIGNVYQRPSRLACC
jgi:hypothetical protein